MNLRTPRSVLKLVLLLMLSIAAGSCGGTGEAPISNETATPTSVPELRQSDEGSALSGRYEFAVSYTVCTQYLDWLYGVVAGNLTEAEVTENLNTISLWIAGAERPVRQNLSGAMAELAKTPPGEAASGYLEAAVDECNAVVDRMEEQTR